MYLKIHKGYRKTIALADKELIGKSFSEGLRQIEVRSDFFKGEKKTRHEALKILQDMQKEDATFNIVGKNAVQTALDAGIINKEGIIFISDVPVALALL